LRISLPQRLAADAVLLLKKRVLNFIMDAQQPFFCARRAIAEMSNLYLKLSRPFFCGSKLKRKLMRHCYGPVAVILRHQWLFYPANFRWLRETIDLRSGES
jgi:hypothetical protein